MNETTSPTTGEQTHEIEVSNASSSASSSFPNTEQAALAYATAGLSVIPVKQDKSPSISSWTELKSRIATPVEITEWFPPEIPGVGIICGAVSGNLECIDIDEKYNVDPVPLLDQLSPLVEVQASGLLARLVHEKSVNGGHHLVYRCAAISGSLKLARREPTVSELQAEPKLKSKVLIETRGEGAYFACYPTPGYSLVSGSFESIPEITPEERAIILSCARSLNRYTKEEQTVTGRPKKSSPSVSRPGDDFEQRGDIAEVLTDAGWSLAFKQGQTEYWRRPGKKDGISATFNHYPNLFYVFTSNADPLEEGRWYSKFALLVQLKHNGDARAAAAELASLGYGQTVVAKAETFLKDRYTFRFNVVTGRVEFASKGATFTTLEDFDLNSIHRKMQAHHIPMGRDSLASLLQSDFSERVDPFVKYYESLAGWDGVDHIAALARTVTMKNLKESMLWEEYLRKWLVASVGCAIDERIVNQTCLVLVGPQGFYKSTWLNSLVPPALSDYTYVGTIDPANKDTLIHLSECFLINLDELETLNKRDLGTLKAVMTLKESRVRRPYGHFAEQIKRRASFVGSINRDSFLSDETGSRRFLVFEIDTINTRHGIDMNLVHAQAYALFKGGFRFWFDTNEIVKVNERNRDYSIQTTEDELVVEYCAKGSSGDWKTATDVAQRIADCARYSLRDSSAQAFGRALKKAGYASKTLNGTKRYNVIVDSGLRGISTSGGHGVGPFSGVASADFFETDAD